jgi:hypothetical protein
MGFIDDKEDLFNEIGAAQIVSEYFPELNQVLSNFQSVKSSDGNIIELLLDLIKSLVDEEVIKDILLGDLLVTIGTWENDLKNTVKDNIMSFYTRNFDFQMPQGPLISIPVSNLDLNDKLKIDPETKEGQFYYKSGAPTDTDFNQILHNTVTNNTPNTSPTYANANFERFVDDFLGSSNLFDISQLISQLFDTVFGNLSSSLDMSYEWFLDQLKMKETIDKIISKNSLNEVVTYDDDFFKFDTKTMDRIRKRASMMVDGNYLSDLGCGLAPNTINPNTYLNELNDLNETKPSLVKQRVNTVMTRFLSDTTQDVSEDNKKAVEFNLISEIIKNIPTIIFNFFITPQIMTIYQMAEGLINGEGLNQATNIPSGLDFRTNSIDVSQLDTFLEKMSNIVTCIVEKIYGLLVEFLFKIIEAYVLDLVEAQLIRFAADQARNYTDIIASINEILSTINNIFSLING